MHSFDTRFSACDVLVSFDAKRVVVEVDSCDGVDTSSDITLYELERMVLGQIYRMQTKHAIWLATREIICETCGKDKNWDTSCCVCPGCYSFSTRMPCQYLCHCAE